MLKKLKKVSVRILVVCGILIIGIMLFISPIAKHLIESNSKEYIGRKVTMNDLSINLFNGKIVFGNLKLYEPDDRKLFLQCKELLVNLNLYRLLFSDYRIEELNITELDINISQNGSVFNFDDLTKPGDKTDTTTSRNSEPVKYTLENINLVNCKIHYEDELVGSKVNLNKLNIQCPKIAWNDQNMRFLTNFMVNDSGKVTTDFKLNSKTLDYSIDSKLNRIGLAVLHPYLKELIRVSHLNGSLSSNFLVKGNFNQVENIALKGFLDIDGLELIDAYNETISSLGKLHIGIDSLDIEHKINKFKRIDVIEPYAKVELYPDGTNFDRLLIAGTPDTTSTGTGTSRVQTASSNIFKIIAEYIADIAKQYVVSDYSAEQVEIKNAKVVYSDFTLPDKFTFTVDSLNLQTQKINTKTGNISAGIWSNLNHTGRFVTDIEIDPKDLLNLVVTFKLNKLPISSFNPYSRYYIAHPFTNGDIIIDMDIRIANHQLKSTNRLAVEKIKVGKKEKTATAYNLPVKLAVAALKNPQQDIDLEIPVEGNLNDPKYKIGKAVWTIIKNIFVKAITSPYNALSHAGSKNNSQSEEIPFQYLQKDLDKNQQQQLLVLGDFLAAKKEIEITLTQLNDVTKECDLLALQEVKKDYFIKSNNLSGNSFTNYDLEKVTTIANTDSLFVAYVNSRLTEKQPGISIVDKCYLVLGGKNVVLQKQKTYALYRNEQIKNYLLSQKNIAPNRIKFADNTDESKVYNQLYPKYLIGYSVDETQEN